MKNSKVAFVIFYFFYCVQIATGPGLSVQQPPKESHVNIHTELEDGFEKITINSQQNTRQQSIPKIDTLFQNGSASVVGTKRIEYFQMSPNVRVYSADEEIIAFVFDHCVKKFVNSIRREDKVEVGVENGIHTLISVMDIVHLMREAQGSKADHVQRLCNGDYTPQLKPLHHAIKHHSKIDTAKVLIEHGARVYEVDENKKTPLAYALQRYVRTYDHAMFLFLIEQGADINAKNENRTLLDEAVDEYRRTENDNALAFLLQRGANIDLVLPKTKSMILQFPYYQNLKKSKK